MERPVIALVIVGIIVSIYSCAYTNITSVVDPQFRDKMYSRVLIISTFSDISYKMEVERQCILYCSQNNISVVAESEILPPVREYSPEEIEERLEEYKIDGILIIALKDYWESNYYVPESSSTTGSATVVGNSIYYSQRKQNYGGFSYSKPRISFESRFYDIESEQFIWRASSLTKGNAFADFSTLARSLAVTTIYRLGHDIYFVTRRDY